MADLNDPSTLAAIAALLQGGGGTDGGLMQLSQLFAPNAEDKHAALTQGLLQFGANTLAAKGVNPWQAIGQGAGAGIGGYQESLQQARLNKTAGLQNAAGAMQLHEGMLKAQDSDLLRKQQLQFAQANGAQLPGGAPATVGGVPMSAPSNPATAGVLGALLAGGPASSLGASLSALPDAPDANAAPDDSTPASPGLPPGNLAAPNTPGQPGGPTVAGVPLSGPATPVSGSVPDKRAAAAKYQAQGDWWMQQGRPTQAQTFYDMAQKILPVLKDTKNMTDANGNRVVVNLYNDGTQEVLPLAPDKEKLNFQDMGGAVQGLDPFTGKPVSAALAKSQSPDSQASNSVAWARLNEEKRHNQMDEGDPANIETTAQGIASGQLPPITGYGLRSAGAQRTMARVMELKPDYNAQDYGTGQAAMKQFTSGKLGSTVRSLNTVQSHLDTLAQAADALNNGNVQAFNQVGNFLAQQTGAPAPTNFNATKQIVADEVVKAIVGSGGGMGDREAAAKTIQAANSPAQLSGVIKQYKDLMSGQLHGLQQQYEQSTGRKDFARFLSPAAQAVENGGATGKGAGASVRAAADAILAGQ